MIDRLITPKRGRLCARRAGMMLLTACLLYAVPVNAHHTRLRASLPASDVLQTSAE